jgi:hypothetical protein
MSVVGARSEVGFRGSQDRFRPKRTKASSQPGDLKRAGPSDRRAGSRRQSRFDMFPLVQTATSIPHLIRALPDLEYIADRPGPRGRAIRSEALRCYRRSCSFLSRYRSRNMWWNPGERVRPLTTRQSSSLAQQSTDLFGGVIDFDLEPRISRLQLPTRSFSSLDSVELCLEVAVNDRHEPFGGRPVSS